MTVKVYVYRVGMTGEWTRIEKYTSAENVALTAALRHFAGFPSSMRESSPCVFDAIGYDGTEITIYVRES